MKFSAPGKIIISGEHSVVYGYPAIASAINRRLAVFSDGHVKSDIPIGVGMGSSAAFAVATSARKILKKGGDLDLGLINQMAYRLEKKHHGNPSGLDNTISTYGGSLWYRRETEKIKIFQSLKIVSKLPEFFIIDSGRPIETTKEMVTKVNGTVKKQKGKFMKAFVRIEEITRLFAKVFAGEEDLDIKSLIEDNERLLEEIGVVSGSTKHLIRSIKSIGGTAKISGAGGYKAGSGLLLAFHTNPERLLHFAKKKNLDIFRANLNQRGVSYE